MRMAFRPRPGNEGVVGTISEPPSGRVFDVGKALKEGDGQFFTDNVQLGDALCLWHGEGGPMLDAFVVPEEPALDGTEADWEPYTPPSLRTPGERVRVELLSEPHVETQDVEAQHGESTSDYDTLNKSELQEILLSRGIDVPHDSKKADLVATLDADDEKGVTGNDS